MFQFVVVGICRGGGPLKDYTRCLVARCRMRAHLSAIRIEYSNGLLVGALCPDHLKPLTDLAEVAGNRYIRVNDALKDRRHLRTRLRISTMEEIEAEKRAAARARPKA